MLASCRFCRKFSPNAAEVELNDRVLFESPNFVAIPTVGSILPGWLLIVPRQHFLCIGAFTSELMREFVSFRDEVAFALGRAFGPVAFFEHGPSTPCTSIGCGVDHAHLHLVPTTVDLREGADRLATGALAWFELEGLPTLSRYHSAGLPYLYVNQFGRSWICTPETIESQLFRKVLAEAVGQPQKFDWKQHSFPAEVEETILKLEGVKDPAVSQSVQ
jgi:diadenosine tetraphosphate (Ap4A) HIT family hydrolase